MDYIIRTNRLCKKYKEMTALNHVSLNIPQGAVYGLIGNNGAGKTTLMRILANLQVPTSGSVQKMRGIRVGTVIETPALYPLLSARGNLKYQMSITGNKGKSIKELLELVRLHDTGKLVVNYSLGMKQRLGLAMALAGNPDFLILDEPLNGLDPEGIKDMRTVIADLNQKYDMSILISSHILGELQKIATDYGFLKNGMLIREFTSTEIAGTDLETFYFENIL